jgi:hypothetical protein
MGRIRQPLAVVIIGAVKPNQTSSAPPARRWPHRSPSRGSTSAPGPPTTPRLASPNWPPGPGKRIGACEPK